MGISAVALLITLHGVPAFLQDGVAPSPPEPSAAAPVETPPPEPDMRRMDDEGEAPGEDEDLPPSRRKQAGKLPQGNPLLAGLAAGGVACLAVPAIALGLTLLAYLPLIGTVVLLAAPFLMGGGMGLGGWVAGSLAGSRRIPTLPLVVAGIVGVVLTVVAILPAYALFGVGFVIASAGMFFSLYSSYAILLSLGGFALAFMGVLAILPIMLVGYGGTSAAIGVMAARMGRGTAEGEGALHFDLLKVPPPGEEGQAGLADEDDEDAPAGERSRKQRQRDDDDDDDDDDG